MSYEVLESRKTYEGKIVTITVDKLRMPDGSDAYRETVIRKKNAAGVLAVDTDGRLLFVRQYRHPFREMLLETPLERLILKTEDLLTASGQRIQDAAQTAYKNGNIARDSYLAILAERKHRKGTNYGATA